MKSGYLKDVLPSPAIPTSLPKNAKWLSGEGCGSWFVIETLADNYFIKRFSPEGKLECEGEFKKTSTTDFYVSKDFKITYMSHCAEVNVEQNSKRIQFKLL